jgi:7,8-dihydropterin-6-yl-methyl-4-(beta-D-ribofuranosyl)aminobenzene 5'-phosphate synthase
MSTISRRRVLMAAPFAPVLLARLTSAGSPSPTLTVLFDNYLFADGCATGWGFSAFIEGGGRTILFDAGADAAVFQRNVDALKVDLARSDFVFASHDHADHTGGLAAVFRKKPGVPVYVPFSAEQQFQSAVRGAGARLIAVKEPQEIAPGIFSTGDLGQGIHEHALILDTPQGLVVVTGCAHPGVVSIVEKAAVVGKRNVWMVLGGFHLGSTAPADVGRIIARFRELGVQRVGATHCTGDAAIAMFRKAFGQNFVELGVGRKIDLGSRQGGLRGG